MVSVGLETLTVIAVTPDQGFIRWRGWRQMRERLAASHNGILRRGVDAIQDRLRKNVMPLSQEVSSPRHQPVAEIGPRKPNCEN